MTIVIDNQITDLDLFEAILKSEEIPLYDPKRHLSSKAAGDRWHINPNAAMDILRERCADFGLEETTVRNPKTGKKMQVFIPKRDS